MNFTGKYYIKILSDSYPENLLVMPATTVAGFLFLRSEKFGSVINYVPNFIRNCPVL